ncbi:hypothetical protein GOBAR_AA10055 [Gossypium barbadense]|uniref:Uncharacterized protein n=1 Tax=Gossypium barbadense TaxID=3634 RepID=A0A2P5Y4W2_GOSBA|nr:hypothetical protein GOBAR_AA10055 [Gossypium barbadense]
MQGAYRREVLKELTSCNMPRALVEMTLNHLWSCNDCIRNIWGLQPFVRPYTSDAPNCTCNILKLPAASSSDRLEEAAIAMRASNHLYICMQLKAIKIVANSRGSKPFSILRRLQRRTLEAFEGNWNLLRLVSS